MAVEQIWRHDLYAALDGEVGHWQNQQEQGPEVLEYWLDTQPGALYDCHQGAMDGELGSQMSVGPQLGVEHLKQLGVGVELQATRRQHSRDKNQQETLEESVREVADENLADGTGTTATTMDIAKLKTVAMFRPVTGRTWREQRFLLCNSYQMKEMKNKHSPKWSAVVAPAYTEFAVRWALANPNLSHIGSH